MWQPHEKKGERWGRERRDQVQGAGIFQHTAPRSGCLYLASNALVSSLSLLACSVCLWFSSCLIGDGPLRVEFQGHYGGRTGTARGRLEGEKRLCGIVAAERAPWQQQRHCGRRRGSVVEGGALCLQPRKTPPPRVSQPLNSSLLPLGAICEE